MPLSVYVAHCKLPSCGYVAHYVVPWEVIAWFPHVPSFPSHIAIVYLCSPSQGTIVCLCSPCHGAIVCLCRPSRVPLFVPKVVHHMGSPLVCQGRLSHDAYMYKVALVMVPTSAKVSNIKVPSCAKVAQVNVPLCPYVAHYMVPRVPMLPTAWCLHTPS